MQTLIKKRKKLHKSKQNLDQGYRLHKNRISKVSSGKDKEIPIRSIKFPLVTNDQELFQKLFEDIKHDYKFISGSMNFADWNPNVQEVSLLELWKTSIKNGLVITRTEPVASRFSLLINPSPEEQSAKTYIKFHEDTGLNLTQSGLDLYFLKDPRKDRSAELLMLRLFQSSQESQNSKNTNKKLSLDDIPIEFSFRLKNIVNNIWEANRSTTAPDKLYNKCKNDLITKYELDSNKARSLGRAFFYHPRLKSGNLEEALDLFKSELERFNSVSGHEEKDMLGGITASHDGLSNFFGYIDSSKELPLEVPEEVRHLFQGLIKNKSKLVNPADYRSQVGGILASYRTNYYKRKEEINGQSNDNKKTDLRSNLKKVEEFLDKTKTLIVPTSYDENKIKDSINQINEWFSEYQIATCDEIFSILEFELADLKSLLNLIVFTDDNLESKNKKSSSKENFNKLLGLLQVAKPVHFPGDTKKQQFIKFYYAHEIFLRLLNFYMNNCLNLSVFENHLDSAEIEKKYLQTLDILWNKYPELSTRFKHVVKAYFAKYILISESDKEEINRRLSLEQFDYDKFLASSELDSMRSFCFYANPRSRVKSRSLAINNLSKESLITLNESIKANWEDILQAFEQDFESRLEDLISAVELEKIRSGIKYFLAGNNFVIDSTPFNKTFNKELFPREKYIDLKLFDELFKNGQPISSRSEQILLTTLRAKLSMMSRKEELARYVVNPIDSEEKFPLIYRLLNEEEQKDSQKHSSNKNRKTYRKHTYSLVLDKWLNTKISKDQSTNEVFIYDKKNGFKNESKKRYSSVIDIQSSVYQTQFLERLAEKNIHKQTTSGWDSVNLSLSSFSFIAEETHKITWLKQESKFRYPQLSLVEGSQRIFTSIPIGIKVNKPKQGYLTNSRRYLGIDVGEYGLAYSIIEIQGDDNKEFAKSKTVNTENVKITNIANGFIHSHLIHKIKDQYRENQKIQRTATFSRPNTKLALIRENVINSLRNRVHYIVLNYKATPIYEFEISNFETGSGKITKIYDSVKRSDPYNKQKVEEGLRKHIWGTKDGIGREIGAYATSYTCINCSLSHYDIDFLINKSENDKKNFSLKKIGDDRFQLNINEINYELSMFLKNFDESNKYSKNEITRAIKDWARPPQDYIQITDEHKQIRGNSSIYRCPFCKVITDADIQASFNIALLGYISDQKNKKTNEDTQELIKLRREKLLTLIKNRNNIINQSSLAEEFYKKGFDYQGYISA